ncbi:MAG TPA: ATP-dependent RNA helicase HrpA [Planctomycetes bacterium]|nr:ATP-dependent RNA helicase HrpA [Planctomycetaceae bacterium]HIM30042.1 ATP-dependent RNA helicase HrpA [Planctomycetota bacterium]
MLMDRFQLRRWRKRLQKSKSPATEEDWREFHEAVASSADLRDRRAAHRPRIEFDASLPISARVQEISETVRRHQVVVVCGETGSGKSTQLPKICLQLGRGIEGLIGHTQPRRIAARTIASRLAQEVNTPLGDLVGYKVRFTDETKPTTLIKLMTDGMLLAETPKDRFLEQYDTLILDEAHERSLNVDFLLGYIKRLLPKRPDLRIIITSATIDVDRFSRHFSTPSGPAPVIEVSGRMYPVEVRWRPPHNEEAVDWQRAIHDTAVEAMRAGAGDILVFLPTERDIRETAKRLRGLREGRETPIILPLYARLSIADQNKVFQPNSSKRRIVLATNVAESSLTVPNITYVIDTGTARLSRYSPRSKVQHLPIERVSQASANQRMGRCGRLGPGVCFRLYSEEDYVTREAFTPPEIRRTNLASVILQTMALRLGSIDAFPFLDTPQPEKIRDGYKTLYELGAIDDRRELTRLGKQLARMPVDPRIGRMILAADEQDCLTEMLVIASALELHDPRERPPERQQAADAAHARFQHPRSDFMSFLSLWDFHRKLKSDLSWSRLRRACAQSFLNYNRLREWGDVHRQLQQLTDQAGMRRRARRDDYDAIHRALLTGLLSNVAMKGDKHQYTGAGGNKFFLWPGSGLFEKKPAWTVAAELVETTKPYLRTVAEINVDWLEPLAEHLVKYSYSEPHWSKKRAQAMAYEKVTLFGLPIVAKRHIPLAAVDGQEARRLLIEFGLAGGELPTRAAFLQHNLRLVAEIEAQGAKQRDRELVIEPWLIEQFYDRVLPDDVVDPKSLDRWRRMVESDNPNVLKMTASDVLGDVDLGQVDDKDFPNAIEMPQTAVPIEYLYEPGDDADGLSLDVPREGLSQLSERRLSWLVPGMLDQKVLALIKSLPKRLRRNFVPAQDVATAMASDLEFGVGSIEQALSKALSRHCGEPIHVGDFQHEKISHHLRIHIRVLDEKGQTVAAGRDLDQLRQQLGVAEEAGPVELADDQWTRDGITQWDFEHLPSKVQIRRAGVSITGYPTLIDRGASVDLRLLDRHEEAVMLHRSGLRRLVVLDQLRSLKEQVKWLPGIENMRLFSGSLPSTRSLDDVLIDWLADRAFCEQSNPDSNEGYRRWIKSGRQRVDLAVQDLCQFAGRLLKNYHRAAISLDKSSASSWADSVTDMRTQLQHLLIADFWCAVPFQWLQHFPRYLAGIARRIDKLSGNLERDRVNSATIAEFDERWREAERSEQTMNCELLQFRYLVEELRISLFAQDLGTAMSVSPQRLEKQWTQVQRTL